MFDERCALFSRVPTSPNAFKYALPQQAQELLVIHALGYPAKTGTTSQLEKNNGTTD